MNFVDEKTIIPKSKLNKKVKREKDMKA